MKKLILFLAAACLLLTGCSKSEKTQELSLDTFQSSDGSYAFDTLSFGDSIVDVEKQLNVSFENSQQTADGITLCTVKDLYTLDGQPVLASMEFHDDGLQMISFSFHPEESEAEQLYTKLTEKLTELYGSPTDNKENERSVPELNAESVCSKVIRWNAPLDNSTSSLQLIMMAGDKIKPTILIGVVVFE